MSTPAQLPLPLGHRPALGREDFLVATGNAAAVAWLDRWPDWPGPALALYGPSGCGKSHLAQVWRARSGARLVRPARLAEADPPALLDGARACVIDPDQPRDEAWPAALDARALLHLYNCLAELGGHLLLLAEHPPARWRIMLPDLRSRLRAAPAVAIGEPDDDLIAAVLVKLFADRQLAVGAEVIGYLQTHMERSFDTARRVVAALDAATLAARRRVTIPLAREILASLDDNARRT
jgi:chromosomal replication initiation ATPase DnaA